LTAPAALTRETRARLLKRERELDELAQLMKQPGTLAEAPEPVPLHRRRGNADREANSERIAA
jgi:hypothetical protein